ncbi:type II toxin-antitoxin system VapC family toxin [Candidatus Ozemobacteraceae bacterium]|nr:type II toxin-antitoxin system VapC family toxin [Candidatus Ozemobacteraceae bacterium]
MKNRYLVDSDVLIDFLRGRPEAVEFLKLHFPNIHLSVISVAELYSGVREGGERRVLESALNSCHIMEVSNAIAIMAGSFRQTFGKSHGVCLPDALIAATAKEYGMHLVTLNVKHFPMFENVVAPYRKA